MIDKPWMGQSTQTECVDDILERVTEVTMHGIVTASPNSPVIRCGFYYGNDTLHTDTLLPEVAYDFSAVFHHLDAGSYYAYAFAVNYVDVSYGDTVRFTVP